ncbi:MAG: ABC transporter permease [Natronomonas sp.]|jgi:ABC-2 type transport system permease protein|uniref:ABC transporter permease n=1 Tax=Natronomonas salsuginis TaxID=2217661 RepID=A0A4U5JGY4_9EURY|nr:MULTISPECIES: ABC transporter permease [Natronomonas]MDR9429566.1 ABC transporter permease [Natronomonas sp.]TKR25309.1 ABC transporter permease [Natronomonas salsuginis]
MTAILRNESRRLRRGSLLLSGLFAMLTAFFLAVFPAIRDEAEVIMDAYPEFVIELMGLEELNTIEGFAGGYIYPFIWVLFGGVYLAYVSAGLIAGDIQSRTLDLTLSNPVSRESVLAQKVAALWVPILALNGAVVVTLALGAVALGERLDIVALAMVHLLGVPYLLVCAGIGVVFSVLFDRVGRAQVTSLGLVFVLWLVDGLSYTDPDYEWIGQFTPSRYYDPTGILVHGEYGFLDASLLLAAFVASLVVAAAIFVRRDI